MLRTTQWTGRARQCGGLTAAGLSLVFLRAVVGLGGQAAAVLAIVVPTVLALAFNRYIGQARV